MASRPIMRWALPYSTWSSEVEVAKTDDEFDYVSMTKSSDILQLVVQAPGGIIAISADEVPEVTVIINTKLAVDILVALCCGYSSNQRVRGAEREILHQGVCTLLDCFNSIASAAPEESTSTTYSKTTSCFQNIPPYYQQALYKVLAILVDSKDWPVWDLDLVEQEEFEISVVIWALKLGPLGLTASIIQGKLVTDILLAAEEWIMENVENDKYEEDKTALECFAGDLRLWGKGVLAATTGGEDQAVVEA